MIFVTNITIEWKEYYNSVAKRNKKYPSVTKALNVTKHFLLVTGDTPKQPLSHQSEDLFRFSRFVYQSES